MSESAITLRPCPFCGADAYVFSDVSFDVDGEVRPMGMTMWFAGCTECPAVMGMNERDRVVAAWNRRARLTREPLLSVASQPIMRDLEMELAYERGRAVEDMRCELGIEACHG